MDTEGGISDGGGKQRRGEAKEYGNRGDKFEEQVCTIQLDNPLIEGIAICVSIARRFENGKKIVREYRYRCGHDKLVAARTLGLR